MAIWAMPKWTAIFSQWGFPYHHLLYGYMYNKRIRERSHSSDEDDELDAGYIAAFLWDGHIEMVRLSYWSFWSHPDRLVTLTWFLVLWSYWGGEMVIFVILVILAIMRRWDNGHIGHIGHYEMVRFCALLRDLKSWSNITPQWVALAYKMTGEVANEKLETNNKLYLTFYNARMRPMFLNDIWFVLKRYLIWYLDNFVFSINLFRESNQILLPNQLTGGMLLSLGSLSGLSNMIRSKMIHHQHFW